jgi:hypothetical protein
MAGDNTVAQGVTIILVDGRLPKLKHSGDERRTQMYRDACTGRKSVQQRLLPSRPGRLAILQVSVCRRAPTAIVSRRVARKAVTSVGEIQLFEYQDPGYVLTCSLKT